MDILDSRDAAALFQREYENAIGLLERAIAKSNQEFIANNFPLKVGDKFTLRVDEYLYTGQVTRLRVDSYYYERRRQKQQETVSVEMTVDVYDERGFSSRLFSQNLKRIAYYHAERQQWFILGQLSGDGWSENDLI